jgi:hypothetical protein
MEYNLAPLPLILTLFSTWTKLSNKDVLIRPSSSNVVFHHARRFAKCEGQLTI